MSKSIKVQKLGESFVVNVAPKKLNNKLGVAISLFWSEHTERVMFHFLDFSSYPVDEVDTSVSQFIAHFDESTASEWVDGFLEKIK